MRLSASAASVAVCRQLSESSSSCGAPRVFDPIDQEQHHILPVANVDECDANLACLLAGAGHGKTLTLTQGRTCAPRPTSWPALTRVMPMQCADAQTPDSGPDPSLCTPSPAP